MNKITLTEIMIIVCVVAIFVATIFPMVTNGTNQTQSVSYGKNGAVETRCISGVQFVVGHSGTATQILDTSGHGIACQ